MRLTCQVLIFQSARQTAYTASSERIPATDFAHSCRQRVAAKYHSYLSRLLSSHHYRVDSSKARLPVPAPAY